ncbi:hypothetical protein L7F22_016017 [Adiantum nelumboides]|nr:hypothetical protein [Adiantum nelumboides]
MSASDEELPDLQKKVVLVTGASSGLGRDFCVALARRGCCIIAAARRTDRLHALLNDITPLQPPLQHVLLPLDVSASEVEIDAAVEKAWQAFGRIDVLINNAGFRGEVNMSLDVNSNEWSKVMATNLQGLWLLSKAVGKRMRTAKVAGSVVNVTSTASLERGLLVGNAAYAASKAAVNQLTKVMALELGKFNIRVNAVAVGLFKSEITEGLFSQPWIHEAAEKGVPLQRWGLVDPDITSLILLLASDLSSYISGNIFIVDGGYSIAGVPLRSSL